jgi:hypothetical protein
VWNLANNQLLHSWQHHERSYAVDFTNEEGVLISSGSRFDWENGGSDNSVYSHDILSNLPISKLIFDDAYFAVSPSGTAIALSSGRPRTNVDGNHTEIRHWDRETLEEWKLPSASRHTFARFSGSGNRLALFDRTWGGNQNRYLGCEYERAGRQRPNDTLCQVTRFFSRRTAPCHRTRDDR